MCDLEVTSRERASIEENPPEEKQIKNDKKLIQLFVKFDNSLLIDEDQFYKTILMAEPEVSFVDSNILIRKSDKQTK